MAIFLKSTFINEEIKLNYFLGPPILFVIMKQKVLGNITNYNIILMQHDLGIHFFLYLPVLFKVKRI